MSVSNRTQSPPTRMKATQDRANALIEAGALEFNGKAPKKSDIARQFEVRNLRPFTYTAIELKNGDVVVKKVHTGGFSQVRPEAGVYTQPLKLDEPSKA